MAGLPSHLVKRLQKIVDRPAGQDPFTLLRKFTREIDKLVQEHEQRITRLELSLRSAKAMKLMPHSETEIAAMSRRDEPGCH